MKENIKETKYIFQINFKSPNNVFWVLQCYKYFENPNT